MALLGGLRADQLIGDLTSQADPGSPAAQKTVDKLKKLGPKVIPRVIDALAMSDKRHTMVFVDILASYVSDKTLQFYQDGLADGAERVVSGTAWALSSANNYNANTLLEFFDNKEVSKPALIEILKVHKNDLSVHELLRRAYELEPKEKAALFAIIEEIVSEEMVPDLINRMGGKDPAIKIHIMRLLGRFQREDIIRALEGQLTDPNKLVRSAALDSLSRREGNINIEKVARLLQDPDLEVQNKAVDVIVKVNHPDTIKYLVAALKDESEYTRRSAVEVLNEICNPNSVKDLLNAIKDDDWWVRARAGDALAEIGGPKVVESRQGQGRGYPPHGHRDTECYQGRDRGRYVDPGHRRFRLVGPRTRRGRTRTDRQQESAAEAAGNARQEPEDRHHRRAGAGENR